MKIQSLIGFSIRIKIKQNRFSVLLPLCELPAEINTSSGKRKEGLRTHRRHAGPGLRFGRRDGGQQQPGSGVWQPMRPQARGHRIGIMKIRFSDRIFYPRLRSERFASANRIRFARRYAIAGPRINKRGCLGGKENRAPAYVHNSISAGRGCRVPLESIQGVGIIRIRVTSLG